MADKQRKISERSLENLKLGSESRKLGKVRHNFTILPETMCWLKVTGNASDAIDKLVRFAKDNGLDSEDTHEQKQVENIESINAYEQKITELNQSLNETYVELAHVRSLLETSRQLEKSTADTLAEFVKDGFKAAEILKAAIGIKGNSPKVIKAEIEKALPLIDDV